MLRPSLAALALFVLAPLATAGTYDGLVTATTAKEITIKVRKDPAAKKGDFTESKTLKLVKTTKYYFGPAEKGDKPKAVTQDQVADAVAEGKKKGVYARIETTGKDKEEEVTRVILFVRKGE